VSKSVEGVAPVSRRTVTKGCIDTDQRLEMEFFWCECEEYDMA
jgi:hypothetical protein